MAGRTGIPMTFTEDVDTTGSATAKYPLGTLRMEETSGVVGLESYRYIYFDNGTAVAAAASGLCYRGVTAARPWEVTSDVSGVKSSFVTGVFMSILTDTYYGWVKTQGYVAALKKKTGSGLGWTLGDYLYAGNNATDDMIAYRIKLAATTKVSGAELRAALQAGIGFAAAAVSSTTATGAAYINLER